MSTKIIVKRAGDIRIHTFIASYFDNNIANATHIIESKSALVLVDGQFLAPDAIEFRAYADSIGKPIERLYLSHRHPDHWFGIGTAFSDISIYALPETTTFITDHGKDSTKDHPNAPDKIIIPQEIAKPGEEVIDGVKYVFSNVVNTEIDFLLTIQLPELGVYITQDLIYSGTHLYLTVDMEHWSLILQHMLLSDYELFMPGHGLPADKNEVGRNMEYLLAAKQAFDNGLKHEDFKNFLLQRYPERKCPGIFDIYMKRLFDGARDY
jgi:glyoxylase-like metal-dependent hydrolase (beta-lactamase superfamily II)